MAMKLSAKATFLSRHRHIQQTARDARTAPQLGPGVECDERCTLEIPEKVRRKAALMGEPGQLWLASLPQQHGQAAG